MANIWQRLLSRGSQTAPRIADDIVESNALQKLAREAGEEAPEVLGKGTSRAAKEAAEDIPEAAFKEITPTTGMDDMSMWNRLDKKKAAALLGLGGAGALMLGGNETQVPLKPEEPVKAVEPKKPEEVKAEVKKTVNTEAPKQDGLDFDALAKKFDEGMASLPKEAEPEVDDFAAAQELANRNLLFAQLGKAASQIGAGIATVGAGAEVKADTSGFDDLAKAADRPLTQLQAKQKHERAKAELGDEKAMRDPKSEISKLVSELATKTGLIKPGQEISAMTLKNSGVNLGTLLSTIEAAKGRKEAAMLAKEAKDQAKLDQMSERQRKFVQGLRKEATTGVLGKQYATYATGQRMQSALEQFAADPSGYKDYATLMGGLKSLQGDESVVREAEVRLGMSATSIFDSLQNQLQKAATGKMLQPEQRKQMIDTIKILTDASKRQYMQSVQPILEQAQMEGIEPGLILSGSLSGAKEQAATPAVETKEFKQQLPPGSTVTTKSGKRYKIGPDGRTGTLIQE